MLVKSREMNITVNKNSCKIEPVTIKCVKYILLETLSPVCKKYTTQGESQVAYIAWGNVECYICDKTITPRGVYFHINEVAMF